MAPSWLPAVGFTVLPSVGSAIVGIGTNGQIETWYATLKKPRWCPPDWVFPPVWATLYTSMGYGSYLIWKELGGFTEDAVVPLGVYGAQLALNWTWSQVFFGAHKIKLAFFEVLLMTGSTAATVAVWYPISRTAAALMSPTLAWLTLATALSYRLWRDNPDKEE
ncbi:hypothetical protein GDO81_011069 [Engystomops pustulosus]|uniref:Translocator protein n=1 Tax=Engystomops pustulosus TaxID=76066 RepID=A0AAV7C5E0_ENGPU|nr:hypothetical protein GDO81_011069 [Engystomops pustulosus]